MFEAKRPNFDVFEHEEELKEPARKKATRRNGKYFALLNFRKLVWFDTAKVNQMLPEEQQIVQTYTLSDLTNLDDLEMTRNRERIKKNLEEFLLKLYNVHTGKEAEPQIPVDDVKQAVEKGEKIYVTAKTIITPSARDLGEEKEVFAKT